MGYHGSPTVSFSKVVGSNRFRDGPDLIDLQQESIARLLLNCRLNTFWVCYGQIISDDLNVGFSSQLRPSSPIILVKGIFAKLNSFCIVLKIWCKTTFISNRSCV